MKKSVVMIVVMAVMIVLSILAITALTLMTQESRRAEDKIRRMRAYYAAQAGSVYAFEEIAKHNNTTATLNPITIGINPSTGNAFNGYPSTGYTPVITRNSGGPSGTDVINVTVTY
jgi:Tfp pilus assembly protein PilX